MIRSPNRRQSFLEVKLAFLTVLREEKNVYRISTCVHSQSNIRSVLLLHFTYHFITSILYEIITISCHTFYFFLSHSLSFFAYLILSLTWSLSCCWLNYKKFLPYFFSCAPHSSINFTLASLCTLSIFTFFRILHTKHTSHHTITICWLDS